MSEGIPLISIITPALNAASTLAEALESVVNQGHDGIEHLLIDARSSDTTLEIASGYRHLTIISENDLGIYDGMNKGARMAKGEWLLFLQADDWLPPGTLDAFVKAIRTHPNSEMICGGAEAVKMSDDGWSVIWSVNDDLAKKLTLKNIALGEPMINARLIRRDLFLKSGGFTLDCSLASDRDFLLKLASQKIPQIEISEMVYRYRWHSGSSTMTEGNRLTQRLSQENLAIAKKHLEHAMDEDKNILKKWHTRLTVQAAMNALENPKCAGLIQAMGEGSSKEPFWIIHFGVEIAHSLPGFLLRGGKTRSAMMSKEAPR